MPSERSEGTPKCYKCKQSHRRGGMAHWGGEWICIDIDACEEESCAALSALPAPTPERATPECAGCADGLPMEGTFHRVGYDLAVPCYRLMSEAPTPEPGAEETLRVAAEAIAKRLDYLEHEAWCGFDFPNAIPCNCGRDAAVAFLRHALATPSPAAQPEEEPTDGR